MLVGFRKTKFTATDLKYEALEFRVLWFPKKALPPREEPDISLSTVNSRAHSILVRYMRNISPKQERTEYT